MLWIASTFTSEVVAQDAGQLKQALDRAMRWEQRVQSLNGK